MENLDRFIDILPQQHPFRMIDGIIEYQEGKSLTAVKNITGSEWVFEGIEPGKQEHFPETLIIEAAAQAALILYHIIKIHNSGRKVKYLLGKFESEFKKELYIGDCLIIKAEASKLLDGGGFSNVTVAITNSTCARIKIFYSVFNY